MARFVLSLVIIPIILMKKSLKQRMANQVQKAEKEKVVKVRERQETHDLPRKAGVGKRIEGDIEALENRIVAIEEEMQANGSDFGKVGYSPKELDEKNEALLENTNAMNI